MKTGNEEYLTRDSSPSECNEHLRKNLSHPNCAHENDETSHHNSQFCFHCKSKQGHQFSIAFMHSQPS